MGIRTERGATAYVDRSVMSVSSSKLVHCDLIGTIQELRLTSLDAIRVSVRLELLARCLRWFPMQAHVDSPFGLGLENLGWGIAAE